MKERTIFYIMTECGCRITEDGLVRKSADKRIKICKEHGTTIDHRERTCMECGKVFEQSKSGQMSDFCQKCREKHLKQKMSDCQAALRSEAKEQLLEMTAGNPQKVWYVCEPCGCRVEQSGMTKIKSGPDFVFRCGEHLSKVNHREATCQWPGCTEIFHQSKSGYVSKFCPEHRMKNAVQVAQEYRENHSDTITIRGMTKGNPGCKEFHSFCGGKCVLNMFPGFECKIFPGFGLKKQEEGVKAA